MLSSPRKIQKLFIKFITWRKLSKAENLLKVYPELDMPWEKAFIEAIQHKSYISVIWLYKTANITLNIHYNHDQLYQDLCKYRYFNYIEWLINCDIDYPWNDITIENSQRN